MELALLPPPMLIMYVVYTSASGYRSRERTESSIDGSGTGT